MAATARPAVSITGLVEDALDTVLAFLPPHSLAVLQMVCRFFAQDYKGEGMCISERSAARRFAGAHIARSPNQTYVQALCFCKTFAGPAAKGYYRFPEYPVSTIALSFSCDRKHFASSHGDHSVKIINFDTGVITQQLEGHPRTPWSVKFHPSKPNVAASGCLGGHVVLWDTNSGQRTSSVRVDSHVLSLAFHPDGNVIAIACTDKLHLWDCTKPVDPNTGAAATTTLACCAQLQPARAIRCVIFHPNGRQVVIGEVPPPMSRAETVKLQLWNYDVTEGLLGARICEPQVLCRTAQLYSDGGIDISSCGRFLVTLSKEGSWLSSGEVQPGTGTKLSVVVMSLREKSFGNVECRLNLEPTAAKHVTSVKISPSKNFLLLGASSVGDDKFTSKHPVVCIFKINWATRVIEPAYEDWGMSHAMPSLRHDRDLAGGVGGGGGGGGGGALVRPSDRAAWAPVVGRMSVSSSSSAAAVADPAAAAAPAGADEHGDEEEYSAEDEYGEDDSNMCLFHPVEGKGVILGTKQGNIKWLRFAE